MILLLQFPKQQCLDYKCLAIILLRKADELCVAANLDWIDNNPKGTDPGHILSPKLWYTNCGYRSPLCMWPFSWESKRANIFMVRLTLAASILGFSDGKRI